jgi:nucleoside-diphosphate-sugar epimerase
VRLAVTGASGFCGSYVARLAAAAGLEVHCLGRRPGPVGVHVPWDATRDVPDLGGVDAVVHLAAAVGDPRFGREKAFRAVNVTGAERLLTAAAGRPVVWVSSASVYRPGPCHGPVREDHPRDGQRNAYGRTKAEGDRMALAAGAVVLRHRAVYGPGDPHLLPRLRRTVRGGRAWLPGPDVPLSLTAVENLADACLAALGRPEAPGQTGPPPAAAGWPVGSYNITDGVVYQRDAAIRAVLGVPVRHVPPGLARLSPTVTRYALEQLTDGLVLDLSRATDQGWRPTRTLEDFVLTTRALLREDRGSTS